MPVRHISISGGVILRLRSPLTTPPTHAEQTITSEPLIVEPTASHPFLDLLKSIAIAI